MSGWVSFDCYGTLVDWEAGMTAALAGVDDIPAVLAAYHEAEPRIQDGPFLRYRDVMSRALAQAGVAPGMEDAFGRTLPGWPVFGDVAVTVAWALVIVMASVSVIGVPLSVAESVAVPEPTCVAVYVAV